MRGERRQKPEGFPFLGVWSMMAKPASAIARAYNIELSGGIASKIMPKLQP
jgi:hypothetical protein